jgi:hypothetical protein
MMNLRKKSIYNKMTKKELLSYLGHEKGKHKKKRVEYPITKQSQIQVMRTKSSIKTKLKNN